MRQIFVLGENLSVFRYLASEEHSKTEETIESTQMVMAGNCYESGFCPSHYGVYELEQ